MIFYSAFETALTVPLWSEAKLRKNSSASRVKESSWFFWFHRYHALDRFRCVTARCVRVCNWLRLVTCSENNAARCVSIIKPSTPGTPPRDSSDLEVSTKLLPRLLHRCRHRLRLLSQPVVVYAVFEKIQELRNQRVGNWILLEFQRNRSVSSFLLKFFLRMKTFVFFIVVKGFIRQRYARTICSIVIFQNLERSTWAFFINFSILLHKCTVDIRYSRKTDFSLRKIIRRNTIARICNIRFDLSICDRSTTYVISKLFSRE